MPADLCEKCREREARVFLTQIIDGVMSKSKLCDECARSSGVVPWDRETMEEMETAKCRYCGGGPCMPARNEMFNVFGLEPGAFMCPFCHIEYMWFVVHELRAMPGPFPDLPPAARQDFFDAPASRLPAGGETPLFPASSANQAQVDAHMKKWVAELRAASCRYCGGRPCVTNYDMFSSILKEKPRGFMCAACARELNRFITTQWKSLRDPAQPLDAASDPEDHMKHLRDLRDKAGVHMKKWASKNGPN